MSVHLVDVEDLVTVDDIAQRLRMSVNATSNLVRGRDGRAKLKFPKPLVGRGTRAVWLWPDVLDWWERTAPKTVEARRRVSNAATMTYRQPSWSHGRKSA